jgi:hypothetical protein
MRKQLELINQQTQLIKEIIDYRTLEVNRMMKDELISKEYIINYMQGTIAIIKSEIEG